MGEEEQAVGPAGTFVQELSREPRIVWEKGLHNHHRSILEENEAGPSSSCGKNESQAQPHREGGQSLCLRACLALCPPRLPGLGCLISSLEVN